jgi:hypothetical protein
LYSGPRVFQWTARFPLLAIELEERNVDAAVEHALAMLDPIQQPLPEELAEMLTEAVERRDAKLLQRAVEVARPLGYS